MKKSILILALFSTALVFSAGVPDETGLVPTLNISFNVAGTTGDLKDTNTGSIAISGTGDYVASPNGKAINLVDSTKNPYGSVGGVVPAATAYTVAFFAKLSGNDAGTLFHLQDSAGGLLFRRGATAGSVVVANAKGAATISLTGLSDLETKWHFYALTVDAQFITLYIDGVPRGQSASGATSFVNAKTAYQFGARHGGMGTGEAKNGGLLDDFRVYARILTAEQLAAVNWALVPHSKKVISLNFATNANASALPATDARVGLEPVAASSWINLANAAQEEAVSIYANDCAHPFPAPAVAWSASTMYRQGSTVSLEATVLRNYLADAQTRTGVGVQITVSDIPFAAYEVIIYQAADSATPFRPPSVNGQFYTFDATGCRIVKGSANYGDANASRTAFTHGVNALRIRRAAIDPADGDFSGALTILGQISAGSSIARGCIAAIQIVEVEPFETVYTRAISADGVWGDSLWNTSSASNQAWVDGATAILNASSPATLSLGVPVQAHDLIIQGKGSLALTGASLSFSGAINAQLFNAADSITIASPVQNENLTLYAHNPNASAAGKLALTGSFQNLTLGSGTLDAAVNAGNLSLQGGSLAIAPGIYAYPVSVGAPAVFRVDSGDAAFTQPVNSNAILTKTGSGNLTFENNLTSTAALSAAAGQVTLKGTANSLPDYPANTVFADGTTTTLTTERLTIATETRTWPMAPGATIETAAFRAANTSASKSVINHTNGTFRVTGNVSTADTVPTFLLAYWTNGGAGTYNLSGGTLSVPNAEIRLSHSGTGTLNISGSGRVETLGFQNCGLSGTIAMSGGSIALNSAGIRSSKIYPKFSGGTLEAAASFSIDSAVELLAGEGPVIEPNSHTITVNQPFSGEGSVTFGSAGSTGSVILAADLSHTGGTVLAGGTLDIGLRTVIPGAVTVQGSPALKINAGILPNYSDSGAFHPSALTFAADASLRVEVDAGGSDVLLESYAFFGAVEGIDASKISVSLVNTGSGFPSGGAMRAVSGPNGTVLFVVSGVIHPKRLFWNGSFSSRWSTDPADINWGDGAVDGPVAAFTDIDTVNFTDLAFAEQTVDLYGSLAPVFLFFNTELTAYTLAGTGGITGSAGIEKTGAGTVTLATANTFTGDISIGAGELILSGTLGTAEAPYSGAVTIAEGAALRMESAAEESYKGVFKDFGTIRKTGSGTLAIKLPQPYFKGQLQVTAGAVSLDNGSSAVHGGGSGIFGDPIYKTRYPVLISGESAVVDLTVNEVVGWSTGQVGYRFAEMKEGATLLKTSQTQNLLRSFLFSGDARMVNAHETDGWKLGPGAVFKATSGTTVFSSTGTPNGLLLMGGDANRTRVEFAVEPGAEIRFDTALACNSINTGILKTGGGLLTFNAATENNAMPTEIEAGTLAVNAAATGAGTYTIGTGATAATLRGSGTIEGTVAVKAESIVETGLTIGTLALDKDAAIRVVPGQELAVGAAFTADTSFIVDLSLYTLGTPRQFVLTLPESASIPSAECVLQGELARSYRAAWVGKSLEVALMRGILITIY